MKKVCYDLLIEIIAIIFGVTIAFVIDDYKDARSSEQNAEEYFGMLKNELSKDTLDFNKNVVILSKERRLVEKLIHALENGQYREFELRMKNFGGDQLFYAKSDLIEHIIESPDFSTIYEEGLFGQLNSTLEDCRMYNLVSERVFNLQEGIRDECLKNSIDSRLAGKEKINHLIFLLYKYGEEIQYKSVLNGTLKEEYRSCIKTLSSQK